MATRSIGPSETGDTRTKTSDTRTETRNKAKGMDNVGDDVKDGDEEDVDAAESPGLNSASRRRRGMHSQA